MKNKINPYCPVDVDEIVPISYDESSVLPTQDRSENKAREVLGPLVNNTAVRDTT